MRAIWHEGACCPSCREDDGTEWALDRERDECCCYAIDLLTGEPMVTAPDAP